MKYLITLQQKIGNSVVAFTIGDLIVCNWGIFCIGGALAGIILIYHNLLLCGIVRSGIDQLVIGICFFAVTGSKLLGMITKWDQLIKDPVKMIKTNRYNFYGGLAASMVFIMIWTIRHQLNIWIVCDGIALSMPLVQVFGRLGCLAHGCCHGRISRSPFSIKITNPLSSSIRVSNFPIGSTLAPVQSVTGLLNLFQFIFLQLLVRYNSPIHPGFITAIYLIMDNSSRFFIDFYRGETSEPVMGRITIHQIFALVFAGTGICIFCLSTFQPGLQAIPYFSIKSIGDTLFELKRDLIPLFISLLIISIYAINYKSVGKI